MMILPLGYLTDERNVWNNKIKDLSKFSLLTTSRAAEND